MKALSLKEPWLQLILQGRKTLEARSWGTAWRGPLVLVSSKEIDGAAMFAFYPEYYTGGFLKGTRGTTHGRKLHWPFPLGEARALVTIGQVRLGTGAPEDDAAACCPTAGRTLWRIDSCEPLEPGWAVKGQLGIFEVAEDMLELMRSRLGQS